MPPEQYIFDGIKSISLDDFDEGKWLYLSGMPDDRQGDISVLRAYSAVPYLYRAADIRAKAIAAMPWALYRGQRSRLDVQDEPQYRGIMRGLRQRLYLTESALCLYGEAYWLKETNRAGLNLTPRWVLPTSISPRFDPTEGLIGFDRAWGDGVQHLKPEQVVCFWTPNLMAELGPGVAPAQVALAAARVLYSLDLLLDGYFKRGAIRPTLLSITGNPPKTEVERLESWTRRLWAGVRNAFQIQGVRSEIKTTVVGDGLEHIQNREITIQQHQHICAAMGVPHSLLSADAANYATSQSDKLTFLNQTVIPSAVLIAEILNEQLFSGLGLRFEFLPNQLEEFQQNEVSKTQNLVPLVESGIMTIDEARAFLGLQPRVEPGR
jgi:hypothetical protein